MAPDFHLKIFPVSSDAFKTVENFLAENKFETCRFLFNFSMTLRQGDQIGWFYTVWATFKVHLDFLKRWRSPKKWQHFRPLLASSTFIHFCLNKQFENMVCCRYFKVSKKWFDENVLDFLIGLWCRYFSISWLCNCLGYFLKNWAIFKSSGYPALLTFNSGLNALKHFWYIFIL